MPKHPDADLQNLIEAIRRNLSPHAVALIAAKLQPTYARGQAGQLAECEVGWFAQQLRELLGEQYESLTNELGL